MDEYFGESAKNYKQPSDKFFTLFPALDRLLPEAKKRQRLIDLACGTGDLYEFARSKGYGYVGLDISEDMLEQARSKHPGAEFVLGDATKLSVKELGKFDVVLCNMLFPSIAKKKDIDAIFRGGEGLMTDRGIMITSSGHPCFDGYMGKKFFGREDIETVYEGYFKSGRNYKVFRKFADSDFIFNDYHWTLSDYFGAARAVGLYLTELDECPTVGDVPKEIEEKINSKGTPSFAVLGWRKLL